jgi:ORF6N domain-containing protein
MQTSPTSMASRRHVSNQQIRRNRKRFPADFLFELTAEELKNLMLHSATSGWGGRRKPPLAFTEHGAIMAATVLNSAQAVEMSVHIVRAFVKLRDRVASNKDLARKLASLERSIVALDLETQSQFDEVFEAIRALKAEVPSPIRPIGFHR